MEGVVAQIEMKDLKEVEAEKELILEIMEGRDHSVDHNYEYIKDITS